MNIIHLNANDNVAVAKVAIDRGDRLSAEFDLVAVDDIPVMYKVAVRAIEEGEAIRKFNQVIGFATRKIAGGEPVHTQNCQVMEVGAESDFGCDARPTVKVPEAERPTFRGFPRRSGKVGTRNYLGILTSVNCSATVARHIAEYLRRATNLDDHPSVDGIVPIVHRSGCGMQSGGEGYQNLQRVLRGYASHPNFGAVLLVGLGCEVMQVDDLADDDCLAESDRFRHLTIQDCGGTKKAIATGVQRAQEMLNVMSGDRRVETPVSQLMLGLQCGGSDAFSGITANPALGRAVDSLVSNGGTAILSETTEIYGAEHLLTRRAESTEIAQALMDRIDWWKSHTAQTGDQIDNNPSPGNKAGGLTTILEKSLGAQAKGGTTNLNGVYKYAEKIDKHGLVFMDSPGYDPVSVTGQVASGANVVCFTTGRGSAFGFKPTPSLKLATNTPLYERQSEDMDINCGTIVDGVTVEEKGQEILQRVISVASGEMTKSEALGYGDEEFAPWLIGATL